MKRNNTIFNSTNITSAYTHPITQKIIMIKTIPEHTINTENKGISKYLIRPTVESIHRRNKTYDI